MYNDTIIVKRAVFSKLVEHLDAKEATVLLGPRQVGKTTLMKALQKHLIEVKKIVESNIFFFNLDILGDQEMFESQEKFITFLRERSKNDFIYVFIDEAQKITEAGVFIKGVYDMNLPLKLVLSGSSSLEIKNKLGEPLTGRKKVFTILPFSFTEFLDYKEEGFQKNIMKADLATADEKYKINSYLNEYLVYGGYPRVVTEKNESRKKELLEEIYSSYIEKDIAGFLKIKEPLAFSNLIKLLAIQNGQLCNVSNISKALNLNQRTVEKYLFYLEQTFVVKKLPPFFSNAKKELVKMPKVYFFDTGLRNLLASDFLELEKRKDRGGLLENFAYNEMAKNLGVADRINFWRNKSGAEVDFVVRKGAEIVPFEIKTKISEPKIEASLKTFLELYTIKMAYILFGEGKSGRYKKMGANISFMPIYKVTDKKILTS
ncbi:MAG: ATP-binding protein [Parcubacteria group bacterium]